MLPRQHPVLGIIIPYRIGIVVTDTGGKVHGSKLPELIHSNLRL